MKKGLSLLLIPLTSVLVILTPNTNIEPSYTETECYHETFQEFKQKEELKKLIQETRRTMYSMINEAKKAKKKKNHSQKNKFLRKVKQRQNLTLLAKYTKLKKENKK